MSPLIYSFSPLFIEATSTILPQIATIIGGWRNRRIKYLRNGLPLELDKTDFSFGQGYFFRFNADQERTTEMYALHSIQGLANQVQLGISTKAQYLLCCQYGFQVRSLVCKLPHEQWIEPAAVPVWRKRMCTLLLIKIVIFTSITITLYRIKEISRDSILPRRVRSLFRPIQSNLIHQLKAVLHMRWTSNLSSKLARRQFLRHRPVSEVKGLCTDLPHQRSMTSKRRKIAMLLLAIDDGNNSYFFLVFVSQGWLCRNWTATRKRCRSCDAKWNGLNTRTSF